MDKIEALREVGRHLLEDERKEAASVLDRHYPFIPVPMTKRRYTLFDRTRTFVSDGFIDRYTGERLVYPPCFESSRKRFPKHFHTIPTGRLM